MGLMLWWWETGAGSSCLQRCENGPGLQRAPRWCCWSPPDGLVLLTRSQLRARVRDELGGLDLVAELLADRRRAAEREEAG